MKNARFAAAILLLGASFGGAGAAAQSFNQERLQAGRVAYQQKKYIEAIDQFRIAAFGSLDQPVVLSECLVLLSLAQSAAGREADCDVTLTRFLVVERRFGVYAKSDLDPGTRAQFRALLERRVPGATVAEAPASSPTPKAPQPKQTSLPAPKS